VPDPIRVSINNPSGGPLFIPRGVTTNVSLICSVTMDALIDVPVIINYRWSGSHFANNSMEFIEEYNATVTGQNMITISPLTLQKAGVYACEVTIMPTPTSMLIQETGGHSSTTIVSLCKFIYYYINYLLLNFFIL
jgi:hypothetical protein